MNNRSIKVKKHKRRVVKYQRKMKAINKYELHLRYGSRKIN